MKNINKYTANIRFPEIERYTIILKESVYYRTSSGKSWKSKPETVKISKITGEKYYNYCDSIPFFRNLGGSERCDFGYTVAGYLVTEIRSINPDYSKKVVRHFYIVKDDETAKRIYKLEW